MGPLFRALCAPAALPAGGAPGAARSLAGHGRGRPAGARPGGPPLCPPPRPGPRPHGRAPCSFTLEALLGVGGMGVVYRAQQHIGLSTRPVAVKLIHPTLLRTAREEALARFQAEMGTLVKLEHEGIARIYDGGIGEDPHTHEPLPYLAMELVRCGVPMTTYAH